MPAHRNIDKLNRLKQATSKLIINSLLFIILSSTIIPALSAIPVSADSSPSYKYYNSGADIGATGGQFGSNTVKVSQNPAGSNTYTGVIQVTVTYNDSWWSWVPLLNIGQKTVTCKAGVQINVNSDKTTGSISTPAELNKPEQVIPSPNATVITNCSAAQAAHITDFNQGSISISGSTSDVGQITNLSENDDTRQLSVTVYSNKPASELPSGIIATLSLANSDIATENLTFNNDSLAVSNQVFFKKINPAKYKVCLTPASIFNFNQCQDVTKVYGVIPSVVFGSWDTISNKEGKLVEVTVNIQMSSGSKDGSYGPLNISLSSVDGSGGVHQLGTAQTNSKVISTVDGSGSSSVDVAANFDSVEPGKYRVCVIGTDFCSDFTKAVNMKSSVKITIPSDKSDQLYNPKTAAAGTCAVDGIGWIVCPVVNFLAKIADSAFTFLSDNFLSTNVKIFDTTSPTYSAWVIMRNIANVAFVIAFMIIIFSQLTGAGITNYGVKKLLPRIVVAAILVNLSYFICQIAVDLSNILGYSLKNLLAGLAPVSSGGTAGFWSGGTWANIAGGILAGAVGIGIIWASLAALVPILLAAVIALVMILFILIARQALIILLIVISPLAFVAFLLPNTDQWFKKWQQTFTAMLMLFPIIALVYGVSSLASNVLSQTFGSGDASLQKTLGQVAAAAVMVLPLFVVPTLLKKSLDGVGNIGATLNGLGGKLGGGLSNKYKGSSFNKYQEAKKADRDARISTGNYIGRGGSFNPNNIRSRLNRGLNNNRVFNTATGGFGAQRTLMAQAQNKKDTQEAISMFNSDPDLAMAWARSGGDKNHAAYTSITDPARRLQFDKMVAAGHGNKATSHLAAAQMLSEKGAGNATDIQNALTHARSSGANDIDISNATQSAISAYRDSGRGDVLAELNTLNGTPMTAAQGWSQVAPSNISRHVFNPLVNPTGAADYQAYLTLTSENTRSALVGYDKMEGRARVAATASIVAAADAHAGGGGAITNIQQAKAHFGVI
ncbi:MAG: hypothetical protein WCJ36_03310 [Candidatus Saccharibacteria bacterium]